MITEDENGHIVDLRDDDREPEPPDDEPLPIDLGQIARHYHEALAEDMSGIPEHCREALAAVPGLLARVHDLQEELGYWRGLEEDTVYASAHGGKQRPDDCLLWVHHRDGEAADRSVEAAAGAATAYMRVRTLHPWVELAEAPF